MHDRRIGVHPPVAQKGPVAALVFKQVQVNLCHQHLFGIVRGLGNHPAEGVGDKRPAPELESWPLDAIAANVAMLHADAIRRGHVDAVGNGVAALDGLPGVMLGLSVLGFLVWVPADGSRIEQHGRALERGQPRGFRVPLVPAHQRPHAADRGVHCLVAKVARGEVELLVIERVVGNVHLAVEPEHATIGADSGRGVVVEPRRPPLKERGDHGDAGLARNRGQALRAGPRDRLRQVEQRNVLALAEVLG